MRAIYLLLLASCATVRPALDPRSAVEKLIRDQYADVERGDLDGWGAALAPGAFLFGSDPQEAYFGREAIMNAMKKNAAGRMRSNIKRTYRSNALIIGVGPNGHSAWVADEIDYVLEGPDGTRQVHFRMSSLLEERDGRWWIAAAHYSVPISHQEAFEKLATGRLPAPVGLDNGIDRGTEAAVELFKRGMANLSNENLSEREGVTVIGTAPKEHWTGIHSIRERLGQVKMTPNARVESVGGIRAALSHDGQAAWVAGNVMLTLQIRDREIHLPFRMLGIYMHERDAWKLACAHSSVAIPD